MLGLSPISFVIAATFAGLIAYVAIDELLRYLVRRSTRKD